MQISLSQSGQNSAGVVIRWRYERKKRKGNVTSPEFINFTVDIGGVQQLTYYAPYGLAHHDDAPLLSGQVRLVDLVGGYVIRSFTLPYGQPMTAFEGLRALAGPQVAEQLFFRSRRRRRHGVVRLQRGCRELLDIATNWAPIVAQATDMVGDPVAT